ncbi:MAG: 3-deoxy-manno-octulosonate cytidylyltransferase [Candidatus Cloacimonetes bacterium]|nr:3-deoxy-manno-octulosonate cytidylyltransferase [Candidatus Cloacimonadota bacterium]
MKVIAIIPARYESTRFPGKPLVKLGTKYIIQHVYERALSSGLFDDVIVGTDDQRIFEAVESFDGKVTLTGKQHKSGTDRIAEVCRKLPYYQDVEIVVNIQGDEPFIAKEPLKKLIDVFNDPKIEVASLMHKLTKDFKNPNIVKVVCDKDNFALYFSRSLIPFNFITHPAPRNLQLETRTPHPAPRTPQPVFYRHIGVYAFRKEALLKFVELPVSKLEQVEKLEQLRLLENGIRIKMIETDYEGCDINTPEDLEKAKKMLSK